PAPTRTSFPYTTLFRSRRLVARVERRNAARLAGDTPGERGLEVVESIDVDAEAGGGDYVIHPYLARVAPPVDLQAHSAVDRLDRSEEHTSELQSPDHLV